MIFMLCENGISYNEIEKADPKDLAVGFAVLLDVIRQPPKPLLPSTNCPVGASLPRDLLKIKRSRDKLAPTEIFDLLLPLPTAPQRGQ